MKRSATLKRLAHPVNGTTSTRTNKRQALTGPASSSATTTTSTTRKTTDMEPDKVELEERHPLASVEGFRGTHMRTFPCMWDKLRVQVHRQIQVGTECSGLESVMVALESLGLQDSCRLAFCCEKDPTARLFLRRVRQPSLFFEDITTRPVADMPACDLYVVGFPCQPWSVAGLNKGNEDRQGRGQIFDHILEYIRTKSPRTFLLENVQGLTYKTHAQVFHNILHALRCHGRYALSWQVLNTAKHGIPQNRERVYIIGILASMVSDDYAFPWPSPVPPKPIVRFLDADTGAARTQPGAGTIAERQNAQLLRKLTDDGANWRQEPYLLDIFASTARYMHNLSPCITRQRGGSMGHWVTCRQGLMTVKELLRLQGLPPGFAKLAKQLKISDRQMGMMVGNAMFVNVLVYLLHELMLVLDTAPSDGARL